MSAAIKRKPRLVHVCYQLGMGGCEIGLLNLIRNRFYKDFDLHVIGLTRGTGEIIPHIANIIGHANINYVLDKANAEKADFAPLIYKLGRSFMELDPEVIILSGAKPQLIGHIAAFPYFGMRTVSYEHNSNPLGTLANIALSLTSLRDSFVFGDTLESLRIRRKSHIGTSKTYEVPMSDVNFATPRQSSRPSEFKLLSLGRLSEEKNYSALIQAVAQLRREGRNVELSIAGEGPLHEQLETTAKNHGVAEHVHFLGFIQARTSLDALRNQAHMYVQPSLYEGQCLALVEALAAGVPSVATNFGGARDYGIDNVNMLKVKGFKASDIADSLRHMIDNYELIAAPMSAAAISMAQDHFGKDASQTKWRLASNAMLEVAARPHSPGELFRRWTHLTPRH